MTSQSTQPIINNLMISVNIPNVSEDIVTINDRGVICECDAFVYRKSFFLCDHIKYIFQNMSTVPFKTETVDSYIRSVYPLLHAAIDPEYLIVERCPSSSPNTPSIFDGHED